MINKYTAPIFLMVISLMNLPAYAEFKKVKPMMEKVKGGLIVLSTVTVTIAVSWCLYKILFCGSTLREMAPILVGAAVIAGATEIGIFLTK